MVGRHELRARLAVHVDELGEQKFDVFVADDAFDVVRVPRLRRDFVEMLGRDSHMRCITGCDGWR